MENNYETAKIIWSEGQLIIDYTKVDFSSQFRNIKIDKSKNNEITVCADKINCQYFYPIKDYYSSEFLQTESHIHNEKYFNLIPDIWVETKTKVIPSIWRKIIGWPLKTKTIKQVRKTGWIELLDTNKPYKFVTNNYLIIS